MGETVAQVWDANTHILGPLATPFGFFSGNGGWITQGVIEDRSDQIIMTRAGLEIRAFDGSFNFQGFTSVGMGWGTFGPWENMVIMVESTGNERPTNRISVLKTSDLSILDTLSLGEVVGQGEYDFGSQAIALTDEATRLLAVGQTGLYIIALDPLTDPVDLNGSVKTADELDICAMVLSSGQYMFSCDPNGVYSLSDLPRKTDGSVKLQVYADGFYPYIENLYGSAQYDITMTGSGDCPDYNLLPDPCYYPDSAEKTGIHIRTSPCWRRRANTDLCCGARKWSAHVFLWFGRILWFVCPTR